MSANRLGVKLLFSEKRGDGYLVSEYRSNGRSPLKRTVIADKHGVHCKGCPTLGCVHVREVQRHLATAKVSS